MTLALLSRLAPVGILGHFFWALMRTDGFATSVGSELGFSKKTLAEPNERFRPLVREHTAFADSLPEKESLILRRS